MARLWEDTIVIALRDLQWTRYASQLSSDETVARVYPSTFVKLDGVAEQTLGDLVVEDDNERFYLLEIKSTQAQIEDEWRRGKRRESKSQPKWPCLKLVSTLADLADESLDDDVRDYFLSMIKASRVAHLFAYWMEDYSGDIENVTGAIMVESYVSGIIRCRKNASLGHESILSNFADNFAMATPCVNDIYESEFHQVDGCQTKRQKTVSFREVFEVANQIPYSAIENQTARSVVIGVAGVERKPSGILTASLRHGSAEQVVRFENRLGLKLNAFKSYIKFLCEDHEDGDEAIHAIVLTSTGRLIRLVTSVGELQALLNPKSPDPDPEPRMVKVLRKEVRIPVDRLGLKPFHAPDPPQPVEKPTPKPRIRLP